jgi:hypothetical protein
MTVQTTPPIEQPAWEGLPLYSRRLIIVTIVSAFAQLLIVDAYFRLQELPEINQYLAGQPLNFIEDGIQYPPMVVSGLICAILIAFTIIYADWKVREGGGSMPWIGSLWMVTSVALVLDLLIDTFEIKWPVIILFAYTGLRSWKGAEHNWLGLILAPTVIVIAALDGLNHASGQDCVSGGLDACPGKAVSDIYLVFILFVLLYVTLRPYLSGGSPSSRTLPATRLSVCRSSCHSRPARSP